MDSSKLTHGHHEEHQPAYYGLPEKVVFCKRCVISNQRPTSVVEFKSSAGIEKKTVVAFDEEGVCSACRYAEMKATTIDWEKRERELLDLCERFKSRNGSYDCIVPGSGGKDSVFASHLLKHKYGMNPLTVTWTPHKFTQVGWANFQAWIDSGFDNILYSPNGKVHRLLTKLAFINLCHPFQPFIIGQKLVGPRVSALYDIPLVFYGENQAEYGNGIKENDHPKMDPSFYAKEPDIDALYLGGVSAKDLMEKHGVSRNDLNPYLPISPDKLQKTGTEVHYLGYYVRWDPQECYYYAAEHCGFQANTERSEGTYSKYSSIDDVVDYLHWYTTHIKFGLGHATHDAAQEVRNGKITREEAVALVRRYDGEFPRRWMPEILDYLAIDEDLFWNVIDRARSPHLWKKDGNNWILRHSVS
ncbi:N-acetyl sugar amidotransferase [Azospirillum sp.]|uniref:N-acetyl sugar amidotransferase n=1 Tax=Azospirillum sp. TaxID=34012 RepID=UPI002637EA20|nr:N-acetyl sugar amidotransferase [Azospirillum sp.]